jgi:hypothetical protein
MEEVGERIRVVKEKESRHLKCEEDLVCFADSIQEGDVNQRM